MLLITRRETEAIVINGSITVKVLEVRGGRVKLGFEFPAGSTVYRQELFAKIQAENVAAVKGAGGAVSVDLPDALKTLQNTLQQKLKVPEQKNEHRPTPSQNPAKQAE
jgi:carbon storage regulator